MHPPAQKVNSSFGKNNYKPSTTLDRLPGMADGL
jgi:hypothetical protein